MPLNEDSEGLVSEFRGLRWEKSSAVKRFTKGRAVRIADIGSNVLKKLDLQEGGARDMLTTNWNLIVPCNFADRCSFESLKNGTLTICAENSAVKQQLLFIMQGILKNAKSFVSDIKKIRVI